MCFYFFSRQSCNPLVLFEAEIEKYCPENFVDIKVGSFGRHGTGVEQPQITELSDFCVLNALELRGTVSHQTKCHDSKKVFPK